LSYVKMDQSCVYARDVYVEYCGATLLDLEHVECHETEKRVVKKRSDCAACYNGEVGIGDYSCPLFDLFRALHPINLDQRKPDENRETVIEG
jgi:hypothetical protein